MDCEPGPLVDDEWTASLDLWWKTSELRAWTSGGRRVDWEPGLLVRRACWEPGLLVHRPSVLGVWTSGAPTEHAGSLDFWCTERVYWESGLLVDD